MVQRITAHFTQTTYPRQFWLMFAGMLISTIGSSMIWPFLMVYASEKLALPLATVAGLMTVSSAMGLITSFIAGPIVDRVGRKWAMSLSLVLNAAGYFVLSQATTLPGFALAMAITGAFNPIYRVGADAMLADLIPPEKRVEAYSLMRMSNNVGVALGPAIGGFIAAASYTNAFYGAMVGLSTYGLLVALFASETLPRREGPPPRERFGGYGKVLRDRGYLGFIASYILVSMCMALIWVLLSVYTKHNFGIPEIRYGLIPTTNALMVIFFQFAVSQVTRRYRPQAMMALGSLFYAAATLGIAFAGGFWGFWLCMVVMTTGELILVPTSSTYAANLAPPEMRGRYMSLYGLTWGIAAGISPVMGGFLSDSFGPRAPWFAFTLVGLAAVAGFLLLRRKTAVEE
jgi:MFS family permease